MQQHFSHATVGREVKPVDGARLNVIKSVQRDGRAVDQFDQQVIALPLIPHDRRLCEVKRDLLARTYLNEAAAFTTYGTINHRARSIADGEINRLNHFTTPPQPRLARPDICVVVLFRTL